MRWHGFLITTFAAAALTAVPAAGATFGSVVAIGGHASDIALDESRSVLYVADFTGNRIDVISLPGLSVQSAMSVAPQPAALSLSLDNQYLLVAHYGNLTQPDPTRNIVTLINLRDSSRQTFNTGDTPLGVAFLADGTALIVTTTSFILFDPSSGLMTPVSTFAGIGKSLPLDFATFPSQVIEAQVSVSPDRKTVVGIADDGSLQAYFRYDLRAGHLYAIGVVASPKPLPRVSVSDDGTWSMIGQYKLDVVAGDLAQFPNSISAQNIGGNAIDVNQGLIYAQILTANATTSQSTPTTPAATPNSPPVLYLLDSDNLTVKESLKLPENIVGRMSFNSKRDTIYAVSDSGVLVLPVGRLNQLNRIRAVQTSVAARNNICNRTVLTLNVTVSDPGGNRTDFAISTTQAGVTLSPQSGTTPATVKVTVDPTQFQSQNGTLTATLNITSNGAINVVQPVRLLINNRQPEQRGSFVDIPGTLTDLLADPAHNRFFIVQQDQNQILVYDSTTYSLIKTLKTATTPTQMAITMDQRRLIVGHDNSQFAFVWDLNTLQPLAPLAFPSGHYPQSIADSGKSLLALVRDVAGDAAGTIDRIDLSNGQVTQLPSLGIYKNSLSSLSVLFPSPNGGRILVASPDGNVLLYDANADTFTVSRKDFQSLQGAYAASSSDQYVVGPNVLNASLVPQATFDTSSGTPIGFAFVDQGAIRTTAKAVNNPGVIQRMDLVPGSDVKPTLTVEAPLAPTITQPFIRTLAPLPDRSAIISLSVSGFMVLPWNYDATVVPPKVNNVINVADGSKLVASGGLISIYGTQMSTGTFSSSDNPLPTSLSETCLTLNNVPVPLMYVSPTQINAQIPFPVNGSVPLVVKSPGGTSANFTVNVLSSAPAVFRTGTAGPETGLANVYRGDNSQLLTPTNPIHGNDTIIIYATGLGLTTPAVDSGVAAPSDPVAEANITPQVTLSGTPFAIASAALVPGTVGVYQIVAVAPLKIPTGVSLPLMVSAGGNSTTLNVRAVN